MIDHTSGPNVITRVVLRGRQKKIRIRGDVTAEAVVKQREEGARKPGNAGGLCKLRNQHLDSPLETAEGTRPCQGLEFSLMGMILDFDPTEL